MQVLMDTGPWVALIDRSETRHGKCVEWLRQFEGEFFTSEAVLTEVLYPLIFRPCAVTHRIVQHTKKKRIITKARKIENTKRKSLDGPADTALHAHFQGEDDPLRMETGID